MSDSQKETCASCNLTTVAAAIGGFAIFALIVFIAYLPKTPAPLPDGVRTPEQRKIALGELRAKEKAAAATYGWIDQPNGVVRIPIAEAITLTIQELNAKK